MTHNSLQSRSLQTLWNPCSQMHDYVINNIPLIPIKSAQGIWLYDYLDNKYLDAVSSWWVNLFGHNNPHITNKIKTQLDSLSHVMLAGFTHEPIVSLSEKLIALTPDNLDKCFYAESGSSAIEIALKMSYHYWKNLNENRTKFIAFNNSYHGETLGALAVSNVDLYQKTYAPLLFEIIKAELPDSFYKPLDQTIKEYCEEKANEFETILAKHHNTIAAVIIEPLVQCSTGMRMHDPYFLQLLRLLCNKYNVHLIADEIAVGFGRTGTMFACEQAAISPDFMCLSKGLTGGFLPLSVCLTSNKIYNAFYSEYNQHKAFLHSHSYNGNALACAAALGTLELFNENNVLDNNKILAKLLYNSVKSLKNHPKVLDIRQSGMILAIELDFPLTTRKNIAIYRYAMHHEVLIRPLGNVVYFMPPYVITPDDIAHLGKVTCNAILNCLKD